MSVIADSCNLAKVQNFEDFAQLSYMIIHHPRNETFKHIVSVIWASFVSLPGAAPPVNVV